MSAEAPRRDEFRRRPFRAPHRRRRLLVRLLKPFALALLVVSAPLAAGLWIYRSPSFTFQGAEIVGLERVEEGWVRSALADLAGRRLLDLELEDVEARLRAHPWIASVAIRKELPDRLIVRVAERRPAARLAAEDEVLVVDREGVRLGVHDAARDPAGLPLLRAVSHPPTEVPAALEVAAVFRRALGDGGPPPEVEVLGEDDYRLTGPGLAFALRVSRARLEPGLARLERLLPGLSARFPEIRQVDLRFTRQIVIESATMEG